MMSSSHKKSGRALRNPMPLIFLGFVFWFVSYLPSWILANGGPPPVFSYIGFLAFGFVAFIFNRRWHFITHKYWIHARGFTLWILIFVAWTIFSYLYSSQSEIATQRLITWLEMAIIMMLFLAFLGRLKSPRAIGVVLALVLVLGSSLNVFDFIHPTFSTVPGRAAGLYINPTISGFILILSMTASISALPTHLRWPILLIGSTGIFLTFSRGAWAVLFVSIVWLSYTGYLGAGKKRVLIWIAAVVGVGALVFMIISGVFATFIQSTSLEQYLDNNTLSRLGLSQFATDVSANEREDVVKFAIPKFLENPNPLLGYGLGYTFEWDFRVGPHNMYLLFLVEGGLIGLLMYLSLFVVLSARASGINKLLIFQLMAYGLFSHNLLDSPARVFFLVLIASGILGTGILARHTKTSWPKC